MLIKTQINVRYSVVKSSSPKDRSLDNYHRTSLAQTILTYLSQSNGLGKLVDFTNLFHLEG